MANFKKGEIHRDDGFFILSIVLGCCALLSLGPQSGSNGNAKGLRADGARQFKTGRVPALTQHKLLFCLIRFHIHKRIPLGPGDVVISLDASVSFDVICYSINKNALRGLHV